jgi:hypothetical protein
MLIITNAFDGRSWQCTYRIDACFVVGQHDADRAAAERKAKDLFERTYPQVRPLKRQPTFLDL